MINFDLPDHLIAQTPASPRDSARLLVYDRKSHKITDSIFSEIGNFLDPSTMLVLNDSKVENCRWLFNDGKLEVFVLQKTDINTIRAMVRPGRRFKLGSTIVLFEGVKAYVIAIDSDGIRTLQLNVNHDDPRFKQFEHIPLPPYIKQNDDLAEEYQTVFAKPLGSKAAPTAGLHFTDKLLGELSKTHAIEKVTLHVGLGTFAPLTKEQIENKKLHKEYFEISAKCASELSRANHRTAVGTTCVRTLETYFREGKLKSSTEILISPGFQFKAANSLITNFHLPGTSLLLLVEAFVGSELELKRIYKHAINMKYRFYSFGDAMLII